MHCSSSILFVSFGFGNIRTANAKKQKKERRKKMRAQMKSKTISQSQETKRSIFFKFLHIQVVVGVYVWDYCSDLTVDNQFF